MKIGFFTNFYLPQTAGIATLIEGYRKELERQGHEVFIFAPKYPRYQDKNPKVFRFKSIDLNYKMSYPMPVISSPRINRIIKQLGLDVIHTHHFLACGQLAWYYATKFNIPLVFTHHTRYDLCSDYLPILPKEISRPLIQLSCAFFSDACDVVIAPTQDVKNSLLKYRVKTPIIIIPSGIDLKRFSDNNPQTVREKYNLSKDAALLLTVSRLGPEKNLLFLLKSFRMIAKKNPNAYFMLVGDGPFRKILERASAKFGFKEKIIFTGEVPNREIPFYYSASNIFVFSSFAEVQPTVITEAMASGLPVVALEANGAKDVIVNKKNGFLCSNNVNVFSKTVLNLIKNPDLAKRISENSIRTAKNYSVEKLTKRLVGCYKKGKKENKSKEKLKNFLKAKSDYFNFNIFFNEK
jgi:glycosyltransferase involved in cell wall biosynthesis